MLQAVGALAVSGSSLYVGGDFTAYRGTAVSDLMKVDSSGGVLDSTFTHPSGPTPYVASLLVANGSVYLGGIPTQYRGASLQNLAKVDAATGVLDTTFTLGQGACRGTIGCAGSGVSSLTPVGSKLYVGGDITSYRGAPSYFFFPVDASTGGLLDP